MDKEFQVDGYWWLPSNPEHRVFGRLSFKPGQTPRLELHGALKTRDINGLLISPGDFKPEIIHGSGSPDGLPFTLYKCMLIKATWLTEENPTTFIARMIIKGVHCDENIKLNKVQVRYSNFEQWANIQPLKVVSNLSNPKQVIIKYRNPKPRIVKIPGYEIGVHWFGPRWSLSLSESTTVSYKTCFVITPDDELTIEKTLILVQKIRNFLSLAMGEPTYSTEVRVFSYYFMSSTLDSSKDFKTPIDLYYPLARWPEEVEEYKFYDMLFTLPKSSAKLKILFKNWFAKYEQLTPVINLYFSVIYSPSDYMEMKFQYAIQALEAYHRRVVGGEFIDKSTYDNEIKAPLIAALPKSINKEFRKKLEDGFGYGYEYSLRRRLKDIILLMNGVLNLDFVTVSKKRAKFVDNVILTRNYWTHYSPESKRENILQGVNLFRITTQLQLMMEVCLLKEVGFTDQEISKFIPQSKRYSFIESYPD